MADDRNVLSNLTRIKEILQSDSGRDCKELNEIVGAKVPQEVCNLINNSKEINSIGAIEPADLFEGLDAFSYDELIEQYQKKGKGNTFFDDWQVDEKFNIKTHPVWDTNTGSKTEEYQHYINYSLSEKLEKELDIKSTKNLIPVFAFQGNYILYHFSDDISLNGIVSAPLEESEAMIIAPSLVSHIDDLLDGLKSGRYFVNEEGIIYPMNWFFRQQLKSGLIKMDSQGDIK